MTPLVQIILGAEWNGSAAGKTVEVDAVRGAWIIEHIKKSVPANDESLAALAELREAVEPEAKAPSPRSRSAKKGSA